MNGRMRPSWWAGLLATAFILGPLVESASALSPVPDRISFQGSLKTSTGPVTGTYSLVFRIFKVPTAGTAVWNETQSAVAVNAGRFNVELGSVTPIPFSVASDSGTFVEVQVGAEVLGPRQPINSSLYAFNAETLGGTGKTGFVDTVSDQTSIGIGGLKAFTGSVRIGAAGTPASTLDVQGAASVSGALSVQTNSTLSGGVVFGTGISPNSGGLKHKRATLGAVPVGPSTQTINWTTTPPSGSPFADAAYTVSCSLVDPTAPPSLRILKIGAVTANTVDVTVTNDSAGPIMGAVLHCIGIHD